MTNKTTEALKLAEKLLDEIHRGNMTPMAEESWNKALAAIREALAEQKDKPAECANGCPKNTVCDYCQRAEPVKQTVVCNNLPVDVNKIIESIKDAEPVKRPQNCGTGYCSCIECPYEHVKQEPVAWMYKSKHTGDRTLEWHQVQGNYRDDHIEIPLYAAPVGADHFLKAIAALREGIATCRAEALEEAAKVLDELVLEHPSRADKTADQCAAAIRWLK